MPNTLSEQDKPVIASQRFNQSNLYVAAFLLVCLAWSATVWFFSPHCHDLRCWGDLGEAFGTLGTLFSGLAFAGLLINIRLQYIEIRQQRQHFSLEQETSARETIERMSLELYSEWHQMQSSRDGFHSAIASLRQGNKVLSWKVLAGKEPAVNATERKALFSVIHFFEKWAILKRHNRLDHDLLLGLIGFYLKEIQELLVEPLLRTDEILSPETDAVKLIRDELLIPAKR